MKASKFFGRAEGFHVEARRRKRVGRGDLPESRDKPGDIFQLEEVVRRSATGRDASVEASRG